MIKDEQKIALVTGAARGIGLATTKLLQAEGWYVLALDRDETELYAACGNLGNTSCLVCDVSLPAQVGQIVQKIRKDFGRLNALINNAGVADFGPIQETDFERWRRVMATNLDGPFLLSQACTELLAHGYKTSSDTSSIVNIASISGLRASTLRVAYGTSKAAIIHLTKQQAVELGEVGIRANAVAPGPVRTKLAMAVHTPEIIAAYHDQIPLNRYGSEEEIANAIMFLCSPQASYISGQLLCADGGFDSSGVGIPQLRK